MWLTLTIIFGWILGALGFVVAGRAFLQADRMRKRLLNAGIEQFPSALQGGEPRLLGRWLSLAGYRSQLAVVVFVGATLTLLLCGAVVGLLMSRSGMTAQMLQMLGRTPGGVGDLFLPFAYIAPWLATIVPITLPALIVRSARRERVTRVEEDLPITLELLATLAEAGLSFDAALGYVIQSQPSDRPLTAELRTFHAETLSGRPRVQCFRRLARRVEVTSLSSFVSAMVQAEQTGAGVARVLRVQADDVRNRRRERAMEAAMSLPVKRVVPLVVCFMPGVFAWALGPAFYQLIQFLDVFTRNRGLR